jgi:hypothetical protein
MLKFEFEINNKNKNFLLKVFSDCFTKEFFFSSTKKNNFFVTLFSSAAQKKINFLCFVLFEESVNSNERNCRTIIGSASMFYAINELYLQKTNYYDTRQVNSVAKIIISACEFEFVADSTLIRTNKVDFIKQIEHNYKPSCQFVQKVKMPYYYFEFTKTLLPGSVFFAIKNFEESVSEDIWISQFVKMFDRASLKVSDIRNTPIESIQSINPFFAIADAICDVVTRYPYICDPEESFDDIFFVGSGDCEDYAKGLMQTFEELKISATKSTSIFMKSIYNLVKNYEAFAALSSVMAESYEKHLFSRSKSLQAHMFVILMNADNAIVLEGTAMLSYLVNNTASEIAVPSKFVKIHSFDYRGFYQKIVYLFDKNANSYLVVDPVTKEYGVEFSQFMKNKKKFQMLKKTFEPGSELKDFIQNTYFNIKTTRRLPLEYNYLKVVYGTEEESFTEMLIIEKKDMTKTKFNQIYNASRVVCIVEENKNFYRFHLKKKKIN